MKKKGDRELIISVNKSFAVFAPTSFRWNTISSPLRFLFLTETQVSKVTDINLYSLPSETEVTEAIDSNHFVVPSYYLS